MVKLQKMTDEQIPTAVKMMKMDVPQLGNDYQDLTDLLVKMDESFFESRCVYFRHYIEDADKYAYSIMANDKMVGYITALILPDTESENNVFIDDFRVQKDEQKKGYGTAAMNAFLALFPDDQKFSLRTEKKLPAYHMYQKLGFHADHSVNMTRSVLGGMIQALETKLDSSGTNKGKKSKKKKS